MTGPTDAPRPPEPLPEHSSENAAPGEGDEHGDDAKQDMDGADRANGEPDATDGGPGSGG